MITHLLFFFYSSWAKSSLAKSYVEGISGIFFCAKFMRQKMQKVQVAEEVGRNVN